MIWEDERKARDDQLGFVLHLGDFVYEVIWYPEDRPQGYYARRLRDIVRYPNGEKIRDFHVPTTVNDYRALYRAYLLDPDLQDARAHWPFVVCETIMSFHGRVGRASRTSAEFGRRRHGKLQPTRPGLNTSRPE